MRRLILIAALCLAACGGPRDIGKENMLTLPSLAREAGPKRALGVLMLAYPTAPSELETYRIAVMRVDGRGDYIAGARWSDFLPEILRASIQETLKNGGAFSYVEPDDGRIAARYTLHTQINRFTVAYTAAGKPPLVDVSLTFSLQSASGGTLARFTTERKVEAKENSMSAIAHAFEQAFLGVEGDLAKKVARI